MASLDNGLLDLRETNALFAVFMTRNHILASGFSHTAGYQPGGAFARLIEKGLVAMTLKVVRKNCPNADIQSAFKLTPKGVAVAKLLGAAE